MLSVYDDLYLLWAQAKEMAEVSKQADVKRTPIPTKKYRFLKRTTRSPHCFLILDHDLAVWFKLQIIQSTSHFYTRQFRES